MENKKFYKKFKALRNLCFGSKQRFNHEDIGWNYRITNMQAALGISQLKRIKQIIEGKQIELKEDRKIYWNNFPIAILAKGADYLSPELNLIIDDIVENDEKLKLHSFLKKWLDKRIVDELLLDVNEPYVELSLISNESTFVAKKAKTFDEEKKVAQKAPVDGITIDNLGTVEKKELPKTSQSNFLYSIKIADFYYKDSAENMIQRIKDETKITNPVIKKLSQTKYRVLLGPFNDIKKIQESFDEIEKLNFENLKIIKDV